MAITKIKPSELSNDSINSFRNKLNIPKSGLFGKVGVCFGDSVTANGTYPEQVSDITGATIYKIGFGGCKMSVHPDSGWDAFSMSVIANSIAANDFSLQVANQGINAGFDATVSILSSIDFNVVDFITINYGTNDFSGSLNIGTIADADRTTWYGAINYVINKIQTAYPAIRILLITPTWRMISANDTDITTNSAGKYLKEYIDAEILCAGANHVPVLDLWRNSGINKYNATEYLTDDVHPTEKGYTLLGQKIAKFILNQL